MKNPLDLTQLPCLKPNRVDDKVTSKQKEPLPQPAGTSKAFIYRDLSKNAYAIQNFKTLNYKKGCRVVTT